MSVEARDSSELRQSARFPTASLAAPAQLGAAAVLPQPRRCAGDRLALFLSLTRRIVVLNLGGLVALLVGFLYLNQFREGLIDARVAKSADARRDHRGRGRRLGHGRDRYDHHRPGETPPTGTRPELWSDRREPAFARVLDQSGADRPGFAPSRVANSDARAHI